MKTLDERMDLIAQRAQVIKEKRRHRRKTAAAIAAPLSLCVLLCCIWLPAGERTGDSAPADGAAGGAVGTILSPYAQVQIQTDGKTSTVTDTEFVSQLYECIAQAEELQQENTALTIPDEGSKNTYTHIDICFYDAAGAQVEYTLSGKALTNRSTGVVNILSSSQLMQLRNVLREIAYEK